MARRTNPFEELERFFDRMSRQFEESAGDWDLGMQMTSGASIDVADRGEEFVVTADLPGYQKEDIDVRLEDDRLTIEAEHDESTEEREGEGDRGQYLRRERSHRSVSRTVTLPDAVDEENVSAEYHNGVLTVTLPKRHASEAEGRHIDIS